MTKRKMSERAERIAEITTEMVGYMVEKGELDPYDDKALKIAIKMCAKDAMAVYDATTEFLS